MHPDILDLPHVHGCSKTLGRCQVPPMPWWAQHTQHVTARSCVASPTVHGSCHNHIDTHPIAQALQSHSDLQTLLAAHLGHATELEAVNPAPPAACHHKVFGCSTHSALQLP